VKAEENAASKVRDRIDQMLLGGFIEKDAVIFADPRELERLHSGSNT
jgi:hypothetical protein